MDYRIARNVNIVLGMASVGLSAYALYASHVYRVFEKLFIAISAFYILEALVFLIWFSNKSKAHWETGWRAVSTCILMSSGAYMIWSTVDIEYKICGVAIKCQEFELKLVAGSVTIGNSIFYLLARPRPRSTMPDVSPDLTCPSSHVPYVVMDTDMPIFVVPRPQLQSPTKYQGPPQHRLPYRTNSFKN